MTDGGSSPMINGGVHGCTSKKFGMVGGSSGNGGEEFGLVPKDVLRKKMTSAYSPKKNNNKNNKINNIKNDVNVLTDNTNTNNNNSDDVDDDTADFGGPIIKDCGIGNDDDKDSMMNKKKNRLMKPEQINEFLMEMDSLLSRRSLFRRSFPSELLSGNNNNSNVSSGARGGNSESSCSSENNNNDEFKKMMLATENYIPTRAANRIESNCKIKMELFGMDRISKKIELVEDLSLDDVEKGYVQLLPTRDLAGRAVLFFRYDSSTFAKKEHQKSVRQILFYMISSALEDDDTARHGISMIIWKNGSPAWFDPFWKDFEKISAPYRISKLHYCQVLPPQHQPSQQLRSSPSSSSSSSSSYQVTEKNDSKRNGTDIRIHKGSLQECMHGMVLYGIPTHHIPINTVNGSINLDEHMKWIELRRQIESFTETEREFIVLVPGQDDVLFGAKRKLSTNGNVLYHETVMKNIKTYHEIVSVEVRNCIFKKVWEAITNRGGRFLLPVEDGQFWEKLDLDTALYKISQAFNYLDVEIFAPKQRQQQSDDDTDGSGRRGKMNKLFGGGGDDDDFFLDFIDGKQCLSLIDNCKNTFTNQSSSQGCW